MNQIEKNPEFGSYPYNITQNGKVYTYERVTVLKNTLKKNKDNINFFSKKKF